MRNAPFEVLSGAARDLLFSWRSLALTDLAYKLLAFAILSPGTALILRWLIARNDTKVLTDADIALFFVKTPEGLVALLLGGALLTAITLLEMACLMAVGSAGQEGARMRAVSALLFGVAKAPAILRLALQIVWRVLVGILPFALALGAIYLLLLRAHDINYYLARRPPSFWVAGTLVAAILLALAALLIRTACRWALALPLVLFEGVSPRHALGESARRTAGRRGEIGLALAGWGVAALALAYAPTGAIHLLGRNLAPHFAQSLALLLSFMAGAFLLWSALALAVGILNASAFSLLLLRFYRHFGDPRSPQYPVCRGEPRDPRPVRRLAGWTAAMAVLAAVGAALLVFLVTRHDRPVRVIAHRGASLDAPENTLPAFIKAAEDRADFVELDVQESADGEVVVVHDSDLMKVAGSPMKIWLASAAQLRSVDLGAPVAPRFAGTRVPTLAEALEACKGRAKVVVELKSYGHNQMLEEKVVALVEAAGMEGDCVFMSLDHGMVAKMKELRPRWRCGILVAKALGDLTTLQADFLAVEARLATARFIRRAHKAGMEVYVWTLDDPAWMLTAMSCGADGLITNKPALARAVIARRESMSDTQRLIAALLVRWGASPDALASEDALRP